MIAALQTGLTMGSIYALLALAINIIYSITDIINFAHGDVVMLGAMIGFSLIMRNNVPYLYGAIFVASIVGMLVLLMYFICIKPLGKRLHTSFGWIMTTVGAGIIIQNFAMIKWGSAPQAFVPLGGNELFEFAGIKILPHEIWVVVITLLIAILFSLMMNKSVLGQAIRAIQFSQELTKLMGISAEKIVLFCFFITGVVGGIAGMLVAPITFVYPTLAISLGLKAFGAAVIGGLGNYNGAFIGGILLGVIEAFSLGVIGISAGYRDIIAFSLMIIVIVLKPEGLLGVKRIEKV